MAASRRRSSDRACEIMLKHGRAKKAAVPASDSALAASRAIDNIATVTKRIKRGEAVDEAYLAALAGTVTPPASAVGSAKRAGFPLVKCVSLAAVVVVVVGLVTASLSMGAPGTHRVSGRLLLNRQAFPGVALVFHSVSSDGTPVRVVTSATGEFTVVDLPEGKYKVSLENEESSSGIPEAYRSPQSTPFSLNVQKDLTDLHLFAVVGRRG